MSFREFYNEDCFSNMKRFKDKTFDCIFIALNEPSLIDGDIFSKLNHIRT